jgi:hypothetical protein
VRLCLSFGNELWRPRVRNPKTRCVIGQAVRSLTSADFEGADLQVPSQKRQLNVSAIVCHSMPLDAILEMEIYEFSLVFFLAFV